MTDTAVAVPAAPPPPSAYPHPVSLPVAPHGDPDAARHLAAAYRVLACDLEAAAGLVDGIVADLALRWHGTGSTALRVPSAVIGEDLATLAAAARTAAGHLEDYATALHKAQHHHGWSLGKILAVGAVVAVTTAAVVVTVGAAAPVGTLAALEVGEAIAGAEAAAGAATVAETAATTALSLTGQTMTALRGLSAVLLPHLTNGAICTGIDTGLHLATGRQLHRGDLAESFAAGFIGSATTTATRSALHATEAFRGASTLGKAALDTTALTATLGTDDALRQYATTGHLNPTHLTETALLTALTGGVATLRNPVRGPNIAPPNYPKPPVKPRPPGAPPATGIAPGEINGGPGNLWAHEGPDLPYGHTIQKHVGQSLFDLRVRLAREPERDMVSTFTDEATAERAVGDVLRQHPTDYSALLSGDVSYLKLKGHVEYECGTVLPRHGSPYAGKRVSIFLLNVNGKIVLKTAYVE
ncbi:MAG: Bacterial CdiA-CT RNAse domain [Frankiales bacterium]|nr:Bacterial CdiA-CT RNAse domain [Frankiales bacterium]